MIDINELRRLAQDATPGPWYARSSNYDVRNIYSANAITDSEGFTFQPVIATVEDIDVPRWRANARLIASANPAAITELLDRLEAAEKSDAESIAMYRKARDERDALRLAVHHEADCVDAAKAEIEALRAKIEAMEQQEPVAWLHESRRDSDVVTSAVKHVWGKVAVGSLAAYSIPLYLAPGAKGE
jgi:hypothetical protein